jgi:hypothetical protein
LQVFCWKIFRCGKILYYGDRWPQFERVYNILDRPNNYANHLQRQTCNILGKRHRPRYSLAPAGSAGGGGGGAGSQSHTCSRKLCDPFTGVLVVLNVEVVRALK